MLALATSCPELKLWAERAKPYGLDPAPKGLCPFSAGTSAHAHQAKDLDHGITEGTETRNFRDSMLSMLPCSRAPRARRCLPAPPWHDPSGGPFVKVSTSSTQRLRGTSGQACHSYGAAALQNGVLEFDFIGRELCSTATSWPCGPGKHNIILSLTRMGLQPRAV